MRNVKSGHGHIDAIKARLVMQAASGAVDARGLYAALESAAPIPTALPKRHLSRDEFLVTYVAPWLAGRLREGETLADIMPDYQVCAAPNTDTLPKLEKLVIEQGYMAVAYSALRDLLHHDDNALSAVVPTMQGKQILAYIEHQNNPQIRRYLGILLRDCANHLATEGPTLCPHQPYQGPPITLAPVRDHLYALASELGKAADPDSVNLIGRINADQ